MQKIIVAFVVTLLLGGCLCQAEGTTFSPSQLQKIKESQDLYTARQKKKHKKPTRIARVAGVYSVGFTLESNDCDFEQADSFDALITVQQKNKLVAATIPGIGLIAGTVKGRGYRVKGKKVGTGHVLITTATQTKRTARSGKMIINHRVSRGGSSCEIVYVGVTERT